MAMLDDLLAALQQKLYSNPYVNQPQPTIGSVASGQAPQQAPQMGGMAGDAQLDLRLRPLYLQYQISQQSGGQEAMPYEQWKLALMQSMQKK
jgi:hypothetical protein